LRREPPEHQWHARGQGFKSPQLHPRSAGLFAVDHLRIAGPRSRSAATCWVTPIRSSWAVVTRATIAGVIFRQTRPPGCRRHRGRSSRPRGQSARQSPASGWRRPPARWRGMPQVTGSWGRCRGGARVDGDRTAGRRRSRSRGRAAAGSAGGGGPAGRSIDGRLAAHAQQQRQGGDHPRAAGSPSLPLSALQGGHRPIYGRTRPSVPRNQVGGDYAPSGSSRALMGGAKK
jgi:hypothetical protein